MQIFVKNLKGTQFKIEVNLDNTVADVKSIIEASKGKDVYPADLQMLIYQGKVLNDEETLAEINVTEKTFIVVMLRKAKGSSSGVSTTNSVPASKPPTASSTPANPSIPEPAPAPATATAEPTPAPSRLHTASPTSTDAPAAVTAPTVVDAYGQAASNLVAGDSLEETIQHILDIGGGTWDRISVVRALRAAFNNPERAIEYLYSGIPGTVDEGMDVVPASPTGQQEAANSPVQAPEPPQPVQPSVQSTGPNANPLNLFPESLPNTGSNASLSSLLSLRNTPQFRALQGMVQANPQILQPMLQEVGRENPQIMRLVQENQAEFLDWMSESSEGEASNFSGRLADAVPQSITVTPEEGEAIERLEAMGFEKTLVLEVFFACNKNEELAANYLLDHINEFEEDDH